MDIKQIKELNEMTKTLQKHGLAKNSEEGSKMAGDMSDADVPEKVAVSAISKEYVEIMFERNNRKISEYISTLKEEITALKNKVDLLEQSMPSHKTYSSPEKIEIKEEPVEEPKQEVQETIPKETKRDNKITKEDVKNGRDPDELDGADVSVENIFYYGNK